MVPVVKLPGGNEIAEDQYEQKESNELKQQHLVVPFDEKPHPRDQDQKIAVGLPRALNARPYFACFCIRVSSQN